MITNRSFITTCAYNENPIYLQSKNQNEGISFFLLHWPNMKERYCTVISSSFFIEVWARSVSLWLVGSTLQHLWHNNSSLNELVKGQNSFDILRLVSFYSKENSIIALKEIIFFPRINNSITSMLPISSIGNARMWKKWKRWKNCPSSYVMLLHNRILEYWKWIVNIVNEQLIYNFKSYLSSYN